MYLYYRYYAAPPLHTDTVVRPSAIGHCICHEFAMSMTGHYSHAMNLLRHELFPCLHALFPARRVTHPQAQVQAILKVVKTMVKAQVVLHLQLPLLFLLLFLLLSLSFNQVKTHKVPLPETCSMRSSATPRRPARTHLETDPHTYCAMPYQWALH